MSGIKILGLGRYLPVMTASNEDFTRIIDTSDEWITTRTGISERHLSSGEYNWYMGASAAREAMETAGVSAGQIGLIIDTTCTADYFTPSESCMIQREIGAAGCMTIDVNCACTGFVYGIDMARRYLATDDSLEYVLVVANETLSKYVDYEDRSSCILFGDGAAAALVTRSDSAFGCFTGADGTGGKNLVVKMPHAFSPFVNDENRMSIDDGLPEGKPNHLYQDGKEVYRFATKILGEAAAEAARRAGVEVSEIDCFLPHQANLRIIETAAKNLNVSMDRFYVNLQRCGNTSSASIPLAMYDAVKEGRIRRGDRICLVGFGAGLTYGAAVFEY